MTDNINRSDVLVDFKDVYGQSITDEVEIKIYNTQLMSLKQVFNVDFQGSPARLQGVPAFPTGHAQMIITPKKYRFKQRFINVEAGVVNTITEYFFVDPSQARPHPIEYADLAAKSYGGELMRILQNSGINQAAWSALNPRIRATILNLSAKMSREAVRDGTKLITFVDSIDRTWLDIGHRERIYARVSGALLEGVRSYPEIYFGVGGDLHHFPPDDNWTPVNQPDSFKTLRDSAGNIQLTFAQNAGGELLCDIDLDDHKGLQHVADVLKHKFSGKDTDPYDIQEILWFFQQLDSEYRLL
jgi:hypothetical protein